MSRPSLQAISDRYGQFTTFGHKDYLEAQKAGWSNTEIKGWLDQDHGRLHPDNRPGGSANLYNQIAAGAVIPSQAVHIDRGPGPSWNTPPPPPPPPPTGGGGGGGYTPQLNPWSNWTPPTFTIPEPPPPPPKMTTMGIGEMGAGSTALGVKTATGIGSDLNIGSTGEVFKRKPKKKKLTENLLPTSGLTA